MIIQTEEEWYKFKHFNETSYFKYCKYHRTERNPGFQIDYLPVNIRLDEDELTTHLAEGKVVLFSKDLEEETAKALMKF